MTHNSESDAGYAAPVDSDARALLQQLAWGRLKPRSYMELDRLLDSVPPDLTTEPDGGGAGNHLVSKLQDIGTLGGRRAALQRLLSMEGVGVDDPGYDGYTALDRAVEAGDVEFVEFILSKGAEVSSQTLRLALEAGHDGLCTDWLRYAHSKKGARHVSCLVNERVPGYQTLLQVAIRHGQHESVDALIAVGAGLYGQTKNTPLITAILVGCVSCVQALLRAGADPRSPDCRGRSPLAIAASVKPAAWSPDIIQTLVGTRAQEDVSDALRAGGACPYPDRLDDFMAARSWSVLRSAWVGAVLRSPLHVSDPDPPPERHQKFRAHGRPW
jgi:hypothetical protein